MEICSSKTIQGSLASLNLIVIIAERLMDATPLFAITNGQSLPAIVYYIYLLGGGGVDAYHALTCG